MACPMRTSGVMISGRPRQLVPLWKRAVTRLARRRRRTAPVLSTVRIGHYLVGDDTGDLLLGHPDIRY